MNRFLLSFFLIFFALALHAGTQMGWIEPEIDGGSHRSMGRVNSLITLYYNPANALFGYLRGFYATDNSAEASAGLGYRHKFDKVTFGTYGFYDAHWSDKHHLYQQCTLGLDLYTSELDFRVNGYLPFSGKHLRCKQTAPGSVQFNFPNTFVISDEVFSCGEEQALYGFDGEVGLRTRLAGVSERCTELNLYGGGYYFTRRKYKSIAGPRGRAELKFTNLSWLNCDLTLGIQFQKNDLQAGKIFGFVRLNIPFGPQTREKFKCPTPIDLTLERRLVERIERLDVVVRERSFTEVSSCRGRAFYQGRAISSGTIIGPGDDIAGIVAGAPENALLLVSGGPVETTSEINMQPGQILISGGSTLSLTCPSCSSALLPTLLPGMPGTIEKQDNMGTLINLANNATVQDLTLQNGETVLNGDDISNVLITGNTISTNSEDAIAISLSNNAFGIQIIDTTIAMTNMAMGTSVAAISLSLTEDVAIENVTINNSIPNSTGISIEDSLSFSIENSEISTADGATGISILGSDGTIRESMIAADTGISLALSGDVSIVSNTIITPATASNATGIGYFSINSSFIVDNTITALGPQSIGIGASAGNTVSIIENTITTQGTGPGSVGIQTQFESLSTISENTIQTLGNSSSAIRILSADQIAITNNTIETMGNSSHGIIGENLTNSAIVNNMIDTAGAPSHGIFLQAQMFVSPNESVSATGNIVNVSGASTGLYSQGLMGSLNDSINMSGNSVEAGSGNGLIVELNDNFTANSNIFTNIGGNVVTVEDSDVTGAGNTSDGSGTFCNSSGANTGQICFTAPAQCCPP